MRETPKPAGLFLAGALLGTHWSVARVIRLSGLPAICSAILILAIGLLWKAHAGNASGDEPGSLPLDPRGQEA